MILVAGGTGRLGSRVVSRLVADGLEVRVLARDPARANQFGTTAVDIVRGDVRDRRSVDRAMPGVTTVVSAVQGFAGPGRVSPASVDRDGNANLVDAAATARADVVLMSVVGASPDSPMDLFRAKYEAEEHLRAAGVQWTIVRATAFVELWAEILAKAPVLGRGENPINFVSVDDVAFVVERAVTDKSLRGQVIEVAGPQNVTFNELAGMLQELRGQGRKTIRHVPRAVLRVMARFDRKPRAALAMDTIDMTVDVATARPDLPMTDLRAALARTVSRGV